jgi:hypothetical protein
MLARRPRKCKCLFTTAAGMEKNALPPAIWAACIDLWKWRKAHGAWHAARSVPAQRDPGGSLPALGGGFFLSQRNLVLD